MVVVVVVMMMMMMMTTIAVNVVLNTSWDCGPECNEKREAEEADSCRYEPTVSTQLTIPHVPVYTHMTSCLVSLPVLTFGSCLGCRVRKTL